MVIIYEKRELKKVCPRGGLCLCLRCQTLLAFVYEQTTAKTKKVPR